MSAVKSSTKKPAARASAQADASLQSVGDAALTAARAARANMPRGIKDPLVIHACARSKFYHVDFGPDGNLPADAVAEYDAATDALIHTQSWSAAGIAYKIASAMELTGEFKTCSPTPAELRGKVASGPTSTRLLASAYVDAMLAGHPSPMVSHRFEAAKADFVRCSEAAQAASDEEAAAWEAYEAIKPTAPPEVYIYASGKPVRIMSVSEVDEQTKGLAPSVVDQVRQAVVAYHEADERAESQCGIDAAEQKTTAAYEAKGRAYRDLMEAPAHDAAAMAFKAHAVARMSWCRDLTDPVTTELLLREDGGRGRGIVLLYRDAMRLAGLHDPTAHVEAFDAAAWVEQFEAHPGHTFTSRGPEYEDPIAWGADFPGEIRITDPEAIARSRAYYRSLYTDKQFARLEQWRQDQMNSDAPSIVGHAQHIEVAYPEGHPERERLLALWQRRLNMHHKDSPDAPLGRHLWTELRADQKADVRAYVKENPPPEDRDWTGEAWIAAYEGAGGMVTVDEDGDIEVGGPVPPTILQRRLAKLLDGQSSRALNLRYYVQQAARARVAAAPLLAAE